MNKQPLLRRPLSFEANRSRHPPEQLKEPTEGGRSRLFQRDHRWFPGALRLIAGEAVISSSTFSFKLLRVSTAHSKLRALPRTGLRPARKKPKDQNYTPSSVDVTHADIGWEAASRKARQRLGGRKKSSLPRKPTNTPPPTMKIYSVEGEKVPLRGGSSSCLPGTF